MDETDPLGGDVPEADRVRAVSIATVIRVATDWSTSDPGMAATLRMIQAMPDTEPERHDAEAFLHMTMARAAWRHADRLREQQRTNERRTERLAAGRANDGRRVVVHGTCPACDAVVRVNMDGMLRAHVAGTGGGWRSTNGRDGKRCEGSGHPPVA